MDQKRLKKFILGKSYSQGGYNAVDVKKYLLEQGDFKSSDLNVLRVELQKITSDYLDKKQKTKKQKSRKIKQKTKKQKVQKRENLLSEIVSYDVSGIVFRYLPAEDTIFLAKNGKLSLTSTQWYEKLSELHNYVFDLYIPKIDYYLKKNSEFSGNNVDFFIYFYTNLGGILSYSYNFEKDYRVLFRRSIKKGDLDLLKYFYERADKIIDPKREPFNYLKDKLIKISLISAIDFDKPEIFKWLYQKNIHSGGKNIHSDLKYLIESRKKSYQIYKYLGGKEEFKTEKKQGKRPLTKEIFILAFEGDFKQLQKKLTDKHLLTAIKGAAKGGHDAIITQLLQFLPQQDYRKARLIIIETASKEGHLFLIKKYALKRNHLNMTLFHACKNNHVNITEYLQEKKNPNLNFYNGLTGAAEGGHFDLFKDMLSKVPKKTGLNEALIAATKKGQTRIVKWTVRQGARRLRRAFALAIQSGYLDIAKWLSHKHHQKTQ